MITDLSQRFIRDELHNFLAGPRCCQQLCGTFRIAEQLFLAQEALNLGCQIAPFVNNGVQTLKIYKRFCLHYLEQPFNLQLQQNSVRDLQLLHENSNFLGSQHEWQMSPDVFTVNSTRPVVPPHRFSIGPLKQSMVRLHIKNQNVFQHLHDQMLPYKQHVMEALQRNRVLVVNGDASFRKSTTLPMYIIERCAVSNAHCKVICVEREQLLAIYKSERLAEQLGEKVGNTVAFQVHLQSRISETSNLIYTTANFLLRVLMGQNTMDSFRHISHVIVGDVQLHEAYADLLLCELRSAFRYHAHLKVVLLSNASNNSEFLNYFGEGEEIRLQIAAVAETSTSLSQKSVNILYMSDIQKLVAAQRLKRSPMLAYAAPSINSQDYGNNKIYLDRCLERYESSGSEQAFEAFLYMVHAEYATINYRHSVLGYTALIIAARLGKTVHLQTLLQLHADPFIVDEQNVNAISNAASGGNLDCIELLNSYCGEHFSSHDLNAAHFDDVLITDLLQMLLTHSSWKQGNILVFVPSFDHLIRLNFSILRHKLIGNIPQQVVVNMLHSNIEKEQLDDLLESNFNSIRIILATEMAETVEFLNSITYIIDSARIQLISYNATSDCKINKIEWISLDSLETRTTLINPPADHAGTCFRLIPQLFASKLSQVRRPELLTMPLDKVCLTIKLLSQHTMVAEYLQNTIVSPPFIHVHHTVECLKKIDIFDDLEDVTWLGCRIIDVPVDCQLGKLLVFAVLLQCLDPILTIVSFLSTADPLQLPRDMGELLQPFMGTIRHKIKQERLRLAEGINADPLIYLRLYQEWQNELRDETPTMALLDEHHFAMNGILERVCDMRTHLVGALRSSQLIHNQGHLSMHYINLKSNSWPMIKAALVGGLYPKICYYDKQVYRLKSTKKTELVLHPSSVLRDLVFQPIYVSAQFFKSPWIVYADEASSIVCNNISCCTLVSPLAVALFAGPTKLNLSNIITQKPQNHYLNHKSLTSTIYMDDWISFQVDAVEAQLILKTRQYFYCTYINYLQHCGNVEKWRRSSMSFTQIPRLFDTLEKILLREDMTIGFTTPENVGLRPKAMPNRFLTTHNTATNWNRSLNTAEYDANNSRHAAKSKIGSQPKVALNKQKVLILEKQFFIVYLSDIKDVSFRKYSNDWLKESVAKIVGPLATPDKLTYVIMYKKNPDQFCSIAIAKWFSGNFKLEECFKNRVPVCELINVCLKHNIYIPSFNERRAAFLIDKRVGLLILNLFAFRNNWLHNN